MSRLPKPDLKNPVHLLAFGFGSGCAPLVPGTFGTLAAVPIYVLLSRLPLSLYLLVLAGVIVAGIWLCGRASRELGVHDHGGIVWDEFAGYFVTMIAAPPGWQGILLGFFLFRLFDIWKPWPIGWLDKKVAGGLGIMVDDLLAGVYALVCLQLAYRFYPW
ncbi:phosphatidylglycerophosphatase A family protein [Thiolapillus brandeum]|uniref:Phosphatidylglycerophosphatase A n=1 Tax=Thiolapillus brandeum TaxID=1076588 RepID=A0A7U6JGQ7_9GAMM|nr:phosphatidylglycerophosphatase A [Thiolapillus brandeum]BAO43779.1 phosphatidylglycerophosphatase A [Thiolapillus brandeum]